MRSQFISKLLIFLVILVSIPNISCKSVKSKLRGNFSDLKDAWSRVRVGDGNTTDKARGRGLLSPLVSISKVLNFFPVGGERECQPGGYNVARAGICLNPYDCRQRDGRAAGDCAHGLGVCCVFEVSCGGVVQNNLTYFLSPGFPELWAGDQDCNVTIEKTYAGIMQLRIDFLHFTIGQPNRRTGECDEDAMILGDREGNFTLCGQNPGQHVYYTLSSASERREAGELPGAKSVQLAMRMRAADMPRIWLMRLAQMPLASSAPHDCLQYYTTDNGTIRTFNYASNGRHLASQDYKTCVRRNKNFCAIRYSPCDDRSFRIQSGSSSMSSTDPEMAEDQMMVVSTEATQDDELEGSGDDPQMDTPAQKVTPPGMMAAIWSYIRSWFWTQGREGRWLRWSPYAQHFPDADDDRLRYSGYGNYGAALMGFGRQRCQDRVTIACENEYFISSSFYGAGVCDPHHCGSTFCPGQQHQNCWVESSITPFAVSVHFGPPTVKPNPEENIGMCLKYTQLPCDT